MSFSGEYLTVYFPLLSKKTLLGSGKYTVKGRVGLTESRIFNYAKQYITPHFITEEHENDNEKN